jgi:hypothetical protein
LFALFVFVCRRTHVLIALFVFVCRRIMSCLPCLCLFAYSGVQHILCCVFVLFASSCVSYVANFSGLSVFIAPSVLSNVYLNRDNQQYLNFNLFTRSN